jgi:hypothetical protein
MDFITVIRKMSANVSTTLKHNTPDLVFKEETYRTLKIKPYLVYQPLIPHQQ